jgi:hypothetical protein
VNPEAHRDTWAEIAEGQSPAEAIAAALAAVPEGQPWIVELMNLPPGRFFPGMARPHHKYPGRFPDTVSANQTHGRGSKRKHTNLNLGR